MLIARDGYRVTQFDPTEDLRCPQCGLACPGVFDPALGIWDGRGQVVSIQPEDRPKASHCAGMTPAVIDQALRMNRLIRGSISMRQTHPWKVPKWPTFRCK